MSKIKAYYFFIAGALLLVVGYFLTVREIRAEYEPEPEEEEEEEEEVNQPEPKRRRSKKEPEAATVITQEDTTKEAETLTPDESNKA